MTKKEQELQLDGQSKMCNWLYNQLFEAVEEGYKKGKPKKLLNGRNLRDKVPKIKQKSLFLYKVHSSPLKNAAIRLKDAYDRFFDKKLDNQKPHYRSWKKKWFSLYYDEPNKGFKLLEDRKLSISFGKLSDEEYNPDIPDIPESGYGINNGIVITIVKVCPVTYTISADVNINIEK